MIDAQEALSLIRMLAGELDEATDWEHGYTRQDLVSFTTQVLAVLHATTPHAKPALPPWAAGVMMGS